MSVLRRYWARLENQRLRLAGASMLLVGVLLILNNPPGGTWNHVGWVFELIGPIGMGVFFFFMLSRKRH